MINNVFRFLFILLFGLLGLPSIFAEDKSREIEATSGSRQFQFLIGDWDIRVTQFDIPSGEVKKEMTAWQHAEYKDNGQMIVDEWTGYESESNEKLSYGITLRTYSDETKQWQNVYFSSNQKVESSSFVSRWKDNEMQGFGQFEVPNLGTINFKLRYFNITKHSYEWEQMLSKDGGKTWFLDLRQMAKRRMVK